ncbi:hypothetical protein GCM10019059_40940 [Camelimonas fluminis]|nr:hypothetical protein GCM10019059_40940 [Camelimonas fluminis]
MRAAGIVAKRKQHGAAGRFTAESPAPPGLQEKRSMSQANHPAANPSVAIITGALGGGLIGILLIAAVVASGSTFGQRCKAMFPEDPARIDHCVKELTAGRSP